MAMAFEAAWQKGFTAACMAHTARFRVASGVRGKCELLRALLRTHVWRDRALTIHIVACARAHPYGARWTQPLEGLSRLHTVVETSAHIAYCESRT